MTQFPIWKTAISVTHICLRLATTKRLAANPNTPTQNTTLASAERMVIGTTTAEHKSKVLHAPTVTTGYVFSVALVLNCSVLL